MAMIIDDRIDIGRRRQFAGETSHLPAELVEHLRAHMAGDQPEEFYAGLLAGLAVATTLYQAGITAMIPQVTCAVADYCERGELSA